jgi:TolB-like protein
MEAPADAVRDQLERMLASPTFASSPRLRTFLRYVVDRALAGEGDQLKEYAIGADVFERGADYDPRIDSIVRVEAGRLRAKLEEYYSVEGAADPVIVRIPRGSYVPLFESREAEAPTPSAGRERDAVSVKWTVAAALLALLAMPGAALWRTAPPQTPAPTERAAPLQTPAPPQNSAPSRTVAAPQTAAPPQTAARPASDLRVAVLPFTHYAPGGADEMLAARITDGVTSELARLKGVGVISRTSALQFTGTRQPLREIAERLGATEVVEGSVFTDGDMVRVRTRIVAGSTDLKSSVRDFEGRRNDVDELVRRIAEALNASFQVR